MGWIWLLIVSFVFLYRFKSARMFCIASCCVCAWVFGGFGCCALLGLLFWVFGFALLVLCLLLSGCCGFTFGGICGCLVFVGFDFDFGVFGRFVCLWFLYFVLGFGLGGFVRWV